MEGKLQTSFIPKQPLVENKVQRAPVTTSIFSVIGWFIFFIALLASVGVYFYGTFIESSIKTSNQTLTANIKSFNTADVDHFVKLDTRLQAANTILNSHLAVSKLFTLISDNTIQSVQFTDIKYTYEDASKITLVLSGKAPNFSSVALQSDTFSAQPNLRNQVFSNLGLDQDGGVLFKFTTSVDSSILKYEGNN